jgi:hypothetical protein
MKNPINITYINNLPYTTIGDKLVPMSLDDIKNAISNLLLTRNLKIMGAEHKSLVIIGDHHFRRGTIGYLDNIDIDKYGPARHVQGVPAKLHICYDPRSNENGQSPSEGGYGGVYIIDEDYLYDFRFSSVLELHYGIDK